MKHLLLFLTAFVGSSLLLAVQCEEKTLTPEELMDKLDPKFKEYLDQCAAEAKVELKTCEEQYKNNPEQMTDECMCIAKCVGEKAGVVKPSGEIIHPELEKQINEIKDVDAKSTAHKLYSSCKDADNGKLGCEGSHLLAACVYVNFKSQQKESGSK